MKLILSITCILVITLLVAFILPNQKKITFQDLNEQTICEAKTCFNIDQYEFEDRFGNFPVRFNYPLYGSCINKSISSIERSYTDTHNSHKSIFRYDEKHKLLFHEYLNYWCNGHLWC